MYVEWNPIFSNPHFFEPLDDSNQKSFSSSQTNTVILPSISRTIQFFKPILVSLGGSKSLDSTVYIFCKKKIKITRVVINNHA